MTDVDLAQLAARLLRRKTKKASRWLSRMWILMLLRQTGGGVGGEIGVWKGEFSTLIRRYVRPKKLHLIDPWIFDPKYPDRMYGGKIAKNQGDMDRIFRSVQEKFADDPTVIIHRGPSAVVLPKFNDDYFDWIYIDGNHSYEFVLDDLQMCLAKVRSGGVITGDDYTWGVNSKYPVRRAIWDFLAENDLEKNIRVVGSQFLIRLP